MLAVPDASTGRDLNDCATAPDAGPRLALDIVPFEPWHFTLLTVQPDQAWIELTQEYAEGLHRSGPCFTAFAGMTVVACAGIIEKWKGSGLVWSLLSNDMKEYRFGVNRTFQSVHNVGVEEPFHRTVHAESILFHVI